MQRFGFTLLILVILGGLGYGGFLAVKSLKDPKSYISDDRETIGDLHQVVTRSNDDSEADAAMPTDTVVSAATSTPAITTVSTPTKDTSLAGRIAKLITDKTVLKKGSRGPDVGTIQEFMNLYFQKKSKVDNDFGNTTESDVKKFQAANKITQTGQTGNQTLNAMVTWLKNH